MLVGEMVVRGEALGLREIAEIIAAPGLDLAGELPADGCQVTVSQVLSPTPASNPMQARPLIEFLPLPTNA